MAGWIKLHRDIQQHWIFSFDEPDKGLAWIDLLMMANIEPKKFMIKGQMIFCDRGQLAVSQETLQTRWNWSRNKVRNYLEMLKKDGMITISSNHLTSIITICNYSGFQDNEPSEGTSEGKPEGTSEGKRLKNIRNKELKNKRNNTNAQNMDGFDDFWDAFGKKVDRAKAEKAWEKIEWLDGLLEKIIKSAKAYSDSITDSKYQKHPATWLNGQCWNDEIILKNELPLVGTVWSGFDKFDYTKGINDDGSF